jgi:hypothetical protein
MYSQLLLILHSPWHSFVTYEYMYIYANFTELWIDPETIFSYKLTSLYINTTRKCQWLLCRCNFCCLLYVEAIRRFEIGCSLSFESVTWSLTLFSDFLFTFMKFVLKQHVLTRQNRSRGIPRVFQNVCQTVARCKHSTTVSLRMNYVSQCWNTRLVFCGPLTSIFATKLPNMQVFA